MGKQYQMVVEVARASLSGAPKASAARPVGHPVFVVTYRGENSPAPRASRARGRGFLHDRASV